MAECHGTSTSEEKIQVHRVMVMGTRMMMMGMRTKSGQGRPASRWEWMQTLGK